MEKYKPRALLFSGAVPIWLFVFLHFHLQLPQIPQPLKNLMQTKNTIEISIKQERTYVVAPVKSNQIINYLHPLKRDHQRYHLQKGTSSCYLRSQKMSFGAQALLCCLSVHQILGPGKCISKQLTYPLVLKNCIFTTLCFSPVFEPLTLVHCQTENLC